MAEPMRLWLDDERPAPEGWFWVRTVAVAQEILLVDWVEALSLDHDLGNGYHDGSELVRWMAEKNVWPMHKPVVHSMNPVGRAYMEGVIDRYFPKETHG